MMPLRYGMQFFPGVEFLVHVMINDCDGSVTVIHGGVEIGQGINTKVSTCPLSIITSLSLSYGTVSP